MPPIDDPIRRRGIFISYRRGGANGFEERLFQALVSNKRLSRCFDGRIFLHYDRAVLEVGRPFEEVLFQRLSTSRLVLLVVGPSWVDTMQSRVMRGERDFVREEVALALKVNCNILAILVDDSRFPAGNEIPHDLHGLESAQQIRVANSTFKAGVTAIEKYIEHTFEDLPANRSLWRSLDKALDWASLPVLVSGIQIFLFLFVAASMKLTSVSVNLWLAGIACAFVAVGIFLRL